MCLLAFAVAPSGTEACPLLIASNRDEYWDRETETLKAWPLPNGAVAYAGRDRRAGGTWLGITASGRVAMLTNIRGAIARSHHRSRGDLVMHWLQQPAGSFGWSDWVVSHPAHGFAGFNLVVGDLRSGRWAWLSNGQHDTGHLEGRAHSQPAPPGWQVFELSAGVYGLSNAGLDTPWPKTVRLKQAVQTAWPHAQAGPGTDWQPPLHQVLMDMRRSHEPGGDGPEAALSSPFVHVPEARYGTRCTTLIRFAHGHWDISEWTHEHERPAACALGDPTKTPSTQDLWPLQHSRCTRLRLPGQI